MSESISVSKNLSLEKQYQEITPQIKVLLNKNENVISNLSNFTAALNQTIDKISWIGFYLFDGQKLYLGPFQGNVACTTIEIGRGVCGTSAKTMETIIVPDVNEFPGHIFCDPESRSEIVVPVINNNKLFGVLDVDSASYNSFGETDKKYLEELCEFLSSEII